MNTLEQRVHQIIATQLGVEPSLIRGSSRLIEDLGADSLDIVELTMALEEQFDTTIADEQAEHLMTVDDLLHYLESISAATA